LPNSLRSRVERKTCEKTKRNLIAHLCFDIEDAPTTLILDSINGAEAGAIVVAREFCKLYESAFLDEVLETLGGNKMIMFSINLSWTWTACGI